MKTFEVKSARVNLKEIASYSGFSLLLFFTTEISPCCLLYDIAVKPFRHPPVISMIMVFVFYLPNHL